VGERIGRRLKLRDLYVLKTVAQLGSMGKAAGHLAVSQPAISQAITDLERVLGVRLLDRSRHGVEPTPQGRAFLKWSAVIFDNLKQGVEEIDHLADPTAGEVRVGTIEIMIAGLVPHIISRLSRQYPRLTFTVAQAATRAMMHRDLRERGVDFTFGRMVWPNTEGDLEVEFLYEDPLVAVGGAGSKWLRRRKIDGAELFDEPWCLPPFDWYAEAAGSVIPRGVPRQRADGTPSHREVEFRPVVLFPGRHRAVHFGIAGFGCALERQAPGHKGAAVRISHQARSDLHCDVEGTLHQSGVAAFHRVRPRTFQAVREGGRGQVAEVKPERLERRRPLWCGR
jgi:DNA-binding transcriptional LysR family regulator